MTISAVPKDTNGVPVAEGYVPGTGPIALQGSTLTNTDGLTNVSTPMNANITQTNSTAVVMGSGDGNTAANVLVINPGLYNGTTVDRQRGNLDNITILASGARTSTTNGADMTNYNHRGIIVVLDVTAPGTGSVTISIQGKDPLSGKYYTHLTGAAVTSTTTNTYKVYPGLPATANVSANDVLAKTFRVNVAHNNANSITYSVGAILIV